MAELCAQRRSQRPEPSSRRRRTKSGSGVPEREDRKAGREAGYLCQPALASAAERTAGARRIPRRGAVGRQGTEPAGAEARKGLSGGGGRVHGVLRPWPPLSLCPSVPLCPVPLRPTTREVAAANRFRERCWGDHRLAPLPTQAADAAAAA